MQMFDSAFVCLVQTCLVWAENTCSASPGYIFGPSLPPEHEGIQNMTSINNTCVLPGYSAPVTRCHWGWVSEAAKALPLVPAPLPLVDPGVRVDHGAVTVPIDDPTKTLATWQLSQRWYLSTSDCLSTLPGSCLPELGSFLDNQKLSELLSNYFSSSYSVYYRLISFPRQEFQPKLHSWIILNWVHPLSKN